MISPEEFLDLTSATANSRAGVKRALMGYIDYDFDVNTYPTEWPRVIIDGQGLSERTYPCLSSYTPIPGDRVVMVPVGTGHVIIGATLNNPTPRLLPGTVVFQATSTLAQVIPSGTDVPVIWDEVSLDLLGGWVGMMNVNEDFRSQYRPTVAGWYKLEGAVGYTTNNSGWRSSIWKVNGTAVQGGTSRTTSATTNAGMVSNARSTTVFLNGVSDYVELIANHNVGEGLALNATSAFFPHVTITYSGTGSVNELLPSVE